MTDIDQRPLTYWPEGSEVPSVAESETDDALPGEVEIAFIELKSTLGDVMSVRARPIGERIAYRVVDENEGAWRLPRDESDEPLTLDEMLDLLDGARLDGDAGVQGLTMGWRQFNLMEPADAPDLVDFVRVTSDFYPEIEQIDRDRAQRWAAEVSGS